MLMASRGSKKRKEDIILKINEEKNIQNENKKKLEKIVIIISLLVFINILVFSFFPVVVVQESNKQVGIIKTKEEERKVRINMYKYLLIPTTNTTDPIEFIVENISSLKRAKNIAPEIFKKEIEKSITDNTKQKIKKAYIAAYIMFLIQIVISFMYIVVLLASYIKKKLMYKTALIISAIFTFISSLLTFMFGIVAGYSTKDIQIKIGLFIWLSLIVSIMYLLFLSLIKYFYNKKQKLKNS